MKLLNKDLCFPENDPLHHVVAVEESHHSDTIISLPEIIENPSNVNSDKEPLIEGFSDKNIRRGFITKVYATVLVQLLVTGGIITWFKMDIRLQIAVWRYLEVFLGVMLMTLLATIIAITCFEKPRRRVPYNYICLVAFTLSLGGLLGVCLSFVSYEEILIGGGITVAIVLLLTLFAFQTKYDFTLASGFIICFSAVILLFGLTLAVSRVPALYLLFSSFAVLIMCLHLVYDTQLMMIGKHRYSISPEEYIFAALTIYLDIMYIFVKVLRIVRKEH